MWDLSRKGIAAFIQALTFTGKPADAWMMQGRSAIIHRCVSRSDRSWLKGNRSHQCVFGTCSPAG